MIQEELYLQLKYIKSCIPRELLKMKPEAICKAYQETKNDQYIFAMFSKVFDSIFTISKKYATIDTEDVVSNALTCLADVMIKFDCEQKVKFDTWFSRCFERIMYAVFKPQLCKKRIPRDELIMFSSPRTELGDRSMSISVGGKEATVEDCLEDTRLSDTYINIELTEMLRNLTPKQYVNDIFVMLYEGYDVHQIRETMPRYSESTIRNIIYKYKNEVRECINAYK